MARSMRDTEQSDNSLMARAKADDADAFADLYDRHAHRALRVAGAICHDTGRTEDVVQEAFLAIWSSRASYRPEVASFQAWSMAIVQNRAIDSLRKAAARPPAQRGDLTEFHSQPDLRRPSPSDQAIARSEGAEMIATLGRLPEEQATVLVLAFYGELSQSEIATELSLPKGTVKGRMRLGLEKLRFEIDSSRL